MTIIIISVWGIVFYSAIIVYICKSLYDEYSYDEIEVIIKNHDNNRYKMDGNSVRYLGGRL